MIHNVHGRLPDDRPVLAGSGRLLPWSWWTWESSCGKPQLLCQRSAERANCPVTVQQTRVAHQEHERMCNYWWDKCLSTGCSRICDSFSVLFQLCISYCYQTCFEQKKRAKMRFYSAPEHSGGTDSAPPHPSWIKGSTSFLFCSTAGFVCMMC